MAIWQRICFNKTIVFNLFFLGCSIVTFPLYGACLCIQLFARKLLLVPVNLIDPSINSLRKRLAIFICLDDSFRLGLEQTNRDSEFNRRHARTPALLMRDRACVLYIENTFRTLSVSTTTATAGF